MANEKRLIDAHDLWSDIMMLPHNGDMVSSEEVEQAIMDAPTVDAVEVVHGRWETVSSMLGYLCCSQCKDVYIWDTWLGDGKWNYCPNCGAKMDLKGEDK